MSHSFYLRFPDDASRGASLHELLDPLHVFSGEYLLTEIDEDETKVIYRLRVEIGILLPGFVRTQGEKRVIENALEGLKRRVELG